MFRLKWKSILSLILPFLISGSSIFPQVTASVPDPDQVPLIHKSELLNGLKVVLVQTKVAPRIVLNLLIKAGSASDLPAKAGTAFLVAQSIRFANQREVTEHFSEEIEDLDAEFQIRIELDSTVLHAEVPSQHLESFLDFLSKTLLRPVFSLEKVAALKQKFMTPRIESPDSVELAEQELRRLVFGKSPYGQPIYGNLRSISCIHPQDLDEFYKTYYCPNNAALIIAGNLEASQIGGLVREKLGGWTKGIKTQIELPLVPVSETFSMLLVKDKQEKAAIALGHTGLPRITPDFYPVTAMNLILGGAGNSSRLAQAFRDRNITHQFVQSEFEFANWGEVIEALKTSPVKESELAAAKEQLLNWYSKVLSSPSLAVDQVTSMELYGLASDFLVSFPKRVQQITKERVEEVSKNYLSTSRATAVIVGDCNESVPELRKVGSLDITERSEIH
jgi:zinc protease